MSQNVGKRPAEAEKKPAEKPVSLHPLEFEEAVADLLRVKPEQMRKTPSK